MKRALINNIKNITGWKTNRKIVVFSVDDYGNVRLDSKQVREKLDKAGLKVYSRFDAYDTLETRQELEALYEVLNSVKDKHGNPAVFTPYALPCNINFEAMAENGYKRYIPELLPDTYSKLEVRHPEAYRGTWKLWLEGIEKGIMAPEFHGREHFNLQIFEDKLKMQDKELMRSLENHSFTSLSGDQDRYYGYTAAFGFQSRDEISQHKKILKDGLKKFSEVYGYDSVIMTPPAQKFSPELEPTLRELGVMAIDRPFLHHQFLGSDKFKREWNYTGKKRKSGLQTVVRNVVFEPTDDRGIDPVAQALQQIEIAFRWNRPANISSHRVNFCGHIDENNRKKGIQTLRKLLQMIVQRWPDVEFISVRELTQLIKNEYDE